MYLILSFLFFDRGSVFLPSTESRAERRCLTFTPPALEDGTLNCHVMMSDIWDPVDFNRGKVKVSDSTVSCDITSQAIMRAGRLGMTLHQVKFKNDWSTDPYRIPLSHKNSACFARKAGDCDNPHVLLQHKPIQVFRIIQCGCHPQGFSTHRCARRFKNSWTYF